MKFPVQKIETHRAVGFGGAPDRRIDQSMLKDSSETGKVPVTLSV